MKKFGKILLWVFLGLISLIIVIFVSAYIYLSSEWRSYYSDSDIKRYADSINQSPNLDKTFYLINDKLHNNDRHKGMTVHCLQTLWTAIIVGDYLDETNYYTSAGRIISFAEHKQNHGYPAFTLGWALAKYTTPEKCFDYSMIVENQELMRQAVFTNDSFKNVCALKDTNEILEYIVKSKAPSKYRRNPDRLKQKIDELKIKLKK